MNPLLPAFRFEDRNAPKDAVLPLLNIRTIMRITLTHKTRINGFVGILVIIGTLSPFPQPPTIKF